MRRAGLTIWVELGNESRSRRASRVTWEERSSDSLPELQPRPHGPMSTPLRKKSFLVRQASAAVSLSVNLSPPLFRLGSPPSPLPSGEVIAPGGCPGTGMGDSEDGKLKNYFVETYCPQICPFILSALFLYA